MRLSPTATVLLALACGGCSTGDPDLVRPDTVNRLFSATASPIISTKKIDLPPDALLDANPIKDTSPISVGIRKYLLASRAVRKQEIIDNNNHIVISTQSADYQTDLTKYRDAGFGASRLWCSYYLNRLEEAHSNLQFQQNSYHLGSALISTLMGVYNSTAKSVAVFAASDTLFSSWLQDYEQYAYLTPSIKKLSGLVYSAQDAYANGLKGITAGGATGPAQPPRDWVDATNQISNYNGFCLAAGMRGLVEDAVGGAQLAFNPQTNTVQVVDQNILTALKRSTSNNSILYIQQAIMDDQAALTTAKAKVNTLQGQINDANAQLTGLTTADVTALKARGASVYDTTADRFNIQPLTDDVAAAQSTLNQAQSTLNQAQSTRDLAQAALKPAQSTLDQAQPKLDQAQSNLKQAQAANPVAQNAVDQASAAVQQATTAVQQANTNLQQANTNLQQANTTLQQATTALQQDGAALQRASALRLLAQNYNSLSDTVKSRQADLTTQQATVTTQTGEIGSYNTQLQAQVTQQTTGAAAPK